MEPKNYLGDNFARVTQVYRVTQYNIACCYSSLNQVRAEAVTQQQSRGPTTTTCGHSWPVAVFELEPCCRSDAEAAVQVDAGLDALKAALAAGFENFEKVSCGARASYSSYGSVGGCGR